MMFQYCFIRDFLEGVFINDPQMDLDAASHIEGDVQMARHVRKIGKKQFIDCDIYYQDTLSVMGTNCAQIIAAWTCIAHVGHVRPMWARWLVRSLWDNNVALLIDFVLRGCGCLLPAQQVQKHCCMCRVLFYLMIMEGVYTT